MSSLLKESNLPSWGRVMSLGIQDGLLKDAFLMYMTPSRLEVAETKNGTPPKKMTLLAGVRRTTLLPYVLFLLGKGAHYDFV